MDSNDEKLLISENDKAQIHNVRIIIERLRILKKTKLSESRKFIVSSAIMYNLSILGGSISKISEDIKKRYKSSIWMHGGLYFPGYLSEDCLMDIFSEEQFNPLLLYKDILTLYDWSIGPARLEDLTKLKKIETKFISDIGSNSAWPVKKR